MIDKADDSPNFEILGKKYLEEKHINDALFLRLNHDNRKTRNELDTLLLEIKTSILRIYDCAELEKVKISRHRYTAHMNPQPRDLSKFRPDADVSQMKSSDLRLLTDRMAFVLDKVRFLSERSRFDSEDRARRARNESFEFWRMVTGSR